MADLEQLKQIAAASHIADPGKIKVGVEITVPVLT